MPLTPIQTFTIIIAITLGTAITRFTPFILFPESKDLPPIIKYLGKTLPPAMMGLLLIYCLKDISIFSTNHALPEIFSIILITIIQLWKRNVLLSIGIGTSFYMILVQLVFI
ncbi:branched-chain amino acid transporter permease [Anaerorhabdus sp.]|jgi:branched-subunit amino acid transport protein AzlD|uniref:branched-chain amino acid transporter permease n=1 Tax=Anaerorhabdus sp. TaxID=1872524 RepID=UPI002FC5B5F7